MMKPSFKFSSIQSSDEKINTSLFSMVIFEHEVSVQIGEVLTCAKCSCEAENFKQHSSIASLAAETTGGEILVSILTQT